jgi:parallel beta-helix repeat protein
VKDVRLENVTSEGNSANGIFIDSFTNVTLKNCLLNGNGENGLSVGGEIDCPKETYMEAPEECPSPEKYSEELTITGCSAENNGVDGFFILAVKNLTIRNCTTNHNKGGIYPFFSIGGEIENCTTNHNENVGICLCRCENITISNCTANENSGGIRMESQNITVENCTVKNNEADGILLKMFGGNTLRNNTVENNEYGIRITEGSSENTVEGNRCFNNEKYDIYSEREVKNFFKDNEFSTAPFLQEIEIPEEEEKEEEKAQPLIGGEDISWENAYVFEDPEGDFWLGEGPRLK